MLTHILKNLTRRKTRTLLTTAGIAIGVAMIVALGAMGEGLRTGYLTMFSGSGSDLTIMQKGAYDITISSVPEEVVQQVAQLPEIKAATGMLVGNVTAPGSPYFFVFGYDPASFAIERFKLVDGSPLGSTKTNGRSAREILVGKQAAESLKLKVGDALTLSGGTFRIVGIYETGSGFEDAAAVAALPDVQNLLQKKRQVGAVQIQLKDERQIDRVRERITKTFPTLNLSKSSQAADQQQVVTMIQGLAWGISLLAVVIGGIGMTNTVMMSVFERTREIGTLRALGWRRRRVLFMVLGESTLLGVVGGVIGCAIGAAVIGPLGQVPALSFLQGRLTGMLLVQGMFTAIVLGAAGGIYPAWWASKLLPIEALRYEGGAGTDSSLGMRHIRSSLLRSLWRRRTRTALTILGIAIGLASVVTLSGLTDGFMGQYSKLVSGGDADLTARQANASGIGYSTISDRAGRQIAMLPGVEDVSGAVMGIVQTEQMPFFIIMGYSPYETAIEHFKMAEGRLISGNREIMIGRPAAALLQVGVGDIIRLKDVGFRVVGIFETGVTWEEGSGIVSLRDAQALFGKPRQVTMLYINVDDPQQAESIRQTIQSAFPEIAVAPSSEFVESGPEMQSMNAMMWAISAMAILVGGIGMANTMFMSVFERTREIGTLRALGWRRRRVLWAVLKESFVLSMIGVLIGVAFSALLSFTLRLIPMWGEALVIILSTALLLQALIIALALGALGGMYPAWRASKLSPVEALRYE